MKNARIAYILSPLELALLMSMSGIGEVCTFQLPRQQDVTDRQMVGAIFSLTEKGYLLPNAMESVLFSLSAEIERCMRGIKLASRTLEFRFEGDELSKLTYCTNEGWTIIEDAGFDGNYRLSWLDSAEVTDWIQTLPNWNRALLDSDWEVEQFSHMPGGDNDDEPWPSEEHPESLQLEEIPDCLCTVCQHGQTTNVQMALIRRKDYLYLVTYQGEKHQCTIYTSECRHALIEKFVYGQEGEL